MQTETVIMAAVLSVIATASWVYSWLWIMLWFIVAMFGAFYTMQWRLTKGERRYTPFIPHEHATITSILLEKLMEREKKSPAVQQRTLTSHSVENAIQELLELVCRDFIFSWYKTLSFDHDALISTVIAEMWQLVDNITSRLSEIDMVTVVTQDVVDTVYEHFKNIRLAENRDGECVEGKHFHLHPWLHDEESEQNCLRQLCEALLLILLPPAYACCDSHRHLLREIISVSVFKVTVDMLCDPDYINQKILAYILQQEKLMADTKRTYTYAASYEDFVKMINASDSVDDLKQMRYKIISEIMQATTINNLKKAQGINTDKETSPRSTTKGELLKARNLKRYINQLTVAKQLVEKRMQSLGGIGNVPHMPDGSERTVALPGQKVLSFAVIMEKPKAREYFMHYLEKDGSDFLLAFWTDVEVLRVAGKGQQHQIGSEVYRQYLVNSTFSLPVDRVTIRGMEVYLRGDGGPEPFYEAQRQVREVLENEKYHSFIVSDLYHQYMSSQQEEEEEEDLDNLSIVSNELFLDSPNDKSDDGEEEQEEMLADQSYHARQLLRQLDCKITNKVQALQALLSSQKLEKDKVKRLQEDMEQEIGKMRAERRQLEAHIEHTKTWTENIGCWKVSVVKASLEMEDDRRVVQFVLLVSLEGGELPAEASEEQTQSGSMDQKKVESSRGWAISRSLEDFYAVHDKLVMIGQGLQKKDLPSQGAGIFRTMDSAYLEKAKTAVSDYMAVVMQDERLIHSEVLYAFLAPSPQFLHQPHTQRRMKFPVSLLKRSLPSLRSEVPDEEDFIFWADEGGKDDRINDSIAKPLYRLLGEVFELRGMFKWVRRSFMTFVELTFGSNINRQLREIVRWTYSEQMLLYYIRTFRDSMWPGGQLAETPSPKTDCQRFETRMAAKNKLLQNIPDTLKNLVGEDNARRGTIKVFEVLQNKTLNKHLLYNLLEIFLLRLCPELKKTHKSLLESLQADSQLTS